MHPRPTVLLRILLAAAAIALFSHSGTAWARPLDGAECTAFYASLKPLPISAIPKLDSDDSLDLVLELAEHSRLTPHQVDAVIRNFHAEITADGATGVFLKDGKVHVSGSVNLLGAYKEGMRTLEPGRISVEDIEKLRARSMEVLSVSGRDGQEKLVAPSSSRKPAGASATVRGQIHPEVKERLERYGYEVRNSKGNTKISYARPPDRGDPLEKFVSELNLMAARHHPPERIAAYAAQELLLIHPFHNGNGRTARLLGQIIYEKLTGKPLVFPPAFHEEMNHGLDDLAKMIALRPPLPAQATLAQQLDDASSATFRYFGTVPKPLDGVLPAHPSQDHPFFPEFKIGKRTIHYAKLRGEEIKPLRPLLFFGKPADSGEQALEQMRLLFRFGRNSRGTPHLDLARHVDSTKGAPSGFMQTTSDIDVARRFATSIDIQNPKADGVVYLIDSTGAQTLGVDQVSNRYQDAGLYTSEGEVVFAKTIKPERIWGAIYTSRKLDGDAFVETQQIYLNPNYRAQSSE